MPNDKFYDKVVGRLTSLVDEIVVSDLDANQIVTAFGQIGLPAHPLFIQSVLERRWQARTQKRA